MTQTNQTLVNFVQNLPITDKVSALKSLIIYDMQGGDFDDFILTLAPLIDFTKVSPLRLILEMGKLKDGTKNVQRFVDDACRYLPTLIQVPDLFYSDYNMYMLFNEFVTYMRSHVNELGYLQNVIRATINADNSSVTFFLQILQEFEKRFLQTKLAQSLEELTVFYNLLAIDEIRYALCQSPTFYQVMSNLFMKSVLPVGQGILDFNEYFGTEENLNMAKLSSLENLLSSYYLQLKNIMLLCCRTNTQEKTFNFIRYFFLDMKRRANDQSYWMARYNFECTLMEISFIKRSEWAKSNPYTPYMQDTLAPMGDEYELSVVGRYSWVDPNNLTLNAMKISYNDKDDEILEDERSWQQILSQVREQKPKPDSNFFFATLYAIDLSSVNFLNILEGIGRQLMIEPNHPLKKQFKQLSLSIQALLCLEFKSSKMIDFLKGAMKFLQTTAQYNSMTKKVPARPPIAYQRLPEYILSSCAKLIFFYHQVGLLRNSNNELFEFIQMDSSLFMNKKYIRNPMIAKEIVQFFASIAREPMGRGNCHLIVTDTVIEEVYPAVVEFFSRVEKTGSHTEYYDKMNMRTPCLLLMEFWMQHRECRNYFIKHYKDQENANFLYFLLSDLTFYIQNCFGEISQLNESISQDDTRSRHFNIQKDNESIRRNIKSEFSTVRDYFNLVTAIASFAPFAFFEERSASNIVKTTVTVLNTSIIPGKLHVDNPEEIQYDEHYFLSSFATFISMLINNETVMKMFVDPKYGFTSDLLNRTMSILENLSKQKRDYSDVCRTFKRFVDAYNSVNILVLPDDVEIPFELTDPITYDLLLDPVTLPSGTVMNRSSVESLPDLKDPIKQTPFTMEQLVVNAEIKKQAEEFFKAHAVPSKA